MFKAIKDGKIIAISDTDAVFSFLEKDEIITDTEHTATDYVEYARQYWLKDEAPSKTHEEIRRERQIRFVNEADPIRYDYDEALARGEPTAEEKKRAWLDKKDEIRAELPYPEEE